MKGREGPKGFLGGAGDTGEKGPKGATGPTGTPGYQVCLLQINIFSLMKFQKAFCLYT